MTLRMGIDPASFLADYWQQQPLLMRQAIDPELFTIDPNALAGMACEADIEARLVVQDGTATWQVHHGPFEPEIFAQLPERDWTLLVQDVDKYESAVADLLDLFDFLPSWRIDDVMISYATDHGGVGPHTDAYDVFLMQGTGTRRWRLSNRKYTDSDLLPDLDLRILRDLDVDEDWLLQPGDVLYLPAGVAHWGTAEGECMTYSLGIRAPNQSELAAEWFQHVVSRASKEVLGSPIATAPLRVTGLDEATVENARRLIEQLPSPDGAAFNDWLGCFLTEPKPQFHIDPPLEPLTDVELRGLLDAGKTLLRHPWARLTWHRAAGQPLQLYCNGESISVAGNSTDVVDTICGHRRLRSDMFTLEQQHPASKLLLTLLNRGIFDIADDQ